MSFFDPERTSKALFSSPHEAAGDIGFYREAVASRASDDRLSAAGQGGGAVTALVETALKKGLIDAVILTGMIDGDAYPRGFVATSEEQVRACTGSRFVGAHSLAALWEALRKGYRKIGIVGLPCQVRSVRKMALQDLKKEGLAERIGPVLGLFCNWAFSSREFTAFLSARLGAVSASRFHIPPPPADCLQIETDQGVESIPLDELRPMIQAACSSCPDMTSEFADLSVGMYEGRDGWNTLITRTDAGVRLVEKAIEHGALETDVFPEENLNHLKSASANKRKRASRDA
jgi:coenzyme F420 hydrogenase subunit beta